jgi:hypothetical protein
MIGAEFAKAGFKTLPRLLRAERTTFHERLRSALKKPTDAR